MQLGSIGSRGALAPASGPRGLVANVARLAGGTALTVALLGFGGMQPAAAQDDTIVLTRGGSTLTVSPGHADAVSAVAEAHASPGHAETIAAAARAVADCEDGALAEGAAALAVAHPDEGAMVVANTVTSMTPEGMAAEIIANNDAVQMIADSNRDDDTPIRTDVEDRCGEEEKKIEPPKEKPPVYEAPAPEVVEIPSTGAGASSLTALSTLFGAAAAAVSVGAVALRRQDAASQAVAIGVDRIS